MKTYGVMKNRFVRSQYDKNGEWTHSKYPSSKVMDNRNQNVWRAVEQARKGAERGRVKQFIREATAEYYENLLLDEIASELKVTVESTKEVLEKHLSFVTESDAITAILEIVDYEWNNVEVSMLKQAIAETYPWYDPMRDVFDEAQNHILQNGLEWWRNIHITHWNLYSDDLREESFFAIDNSDLLSLGKGGRAVNAVHNKARIIMD